MNAEYVSPVSQVFHTVVTVRIGLKTQLFNSHWCTSSLIGNKEGTKNYQTEVQKRRAEQGMHKVLLTSIKLHMLLVGHSIVILTASL